MKVLYFGALWCPSCLVMRPVWKKLEKAFDFEIVEYDYDFDPDIVKEYKVTDLLPTCVIVNSNGEEIKRVVGEKSKKELENILNAL